MDLLCMDFDELLYRASLLNHQAAKYLGVSTKTIERWRKTGAAPTTATRALEYRAGLHPQWPGFRFLDGIVITPCGHSVKAIEIDQIPFYNRLHYSSGKDDARRVLKGKVEAASKMDQNRPGAS
jgi:hypothetical protein